MLLEFSVTAESNSLSEETRAQLPGVKTESDADTVEMQTLIYFIHVPSFVSCRMLL